MAIWDEISNIFSGGGRGDINSGYNDANNYLNPYRQGGMQDYNNLRSMNANWGNQLGQYGNAGDWMYKQINQSPTDYYNSIMSGYSESPEAKYEQQQALRASDAGASASGMTGSGAFMKGIQQNAADISNRDRDRYYGNVMNANNAQMGYLQNLQNQQAQQRQMQQYLTQLGYGAGSEMGQNNINRGGALSKIDQSAFDQIAGLIGAGGQNFKNNSMMNSAGGNIPWYLMFM